jgi:glycosyltransferase involved in cell wall biosynthesis
MTITVILCTYNRSESLRNALEGAASLKVPEPDQWEVLVVDNNSNDRTREVVEDFCRRYPGRFHYLFEPQQGKSFALNAGIRDARGDVLAFMDDDVTVEPTWLQNLTASLHDPAWAGAGGRILPRRTFTPPRWLSLGAQRAVAPFALFDLGADAGELTQPPFGTNMAFRRETFEKYGGFRTDLGPHPHSRIRGEDSEFGGRLLAQGERLRYEPSAVVYHDIPAYRVEKRYFLDWWFDKGRADIRTWGVPRDNRCRVGGVPLLFLRRIVACTLRGLTSVQPARRFASRIDVWFLAGQILECYRVSHGTRQGKI